MLTVETPMGILHATRLNYANHPGIWIELQRQGEKEFDPLVLVEYTNDEEVCKIIRRLSSLDLLRK